MPKRWIPRPIGYPFDLTKPPRFLGPFLSCGFPSPGPQKKPGRSGRHRDRRSIDGRAGPGLSLFDAINPSLCGSGCVFGRGCECGMQGFMGNKKVSHCSSTKAPGRGECPRPPTPLSVRWGSGHPLSPPCVPVKPWWAGSPVCGLSVR